MMYYPLSTPLVLLMLAADAPNLVSANRGSLRHRSLQISPYFTSTDLGTENMAAASGNPLKGLVGGARFSSPPLDETVPLSMEWYNVGVSRLSRYILKA